MIETVSSELETVAIKECWPHICSTVHKNPETDIGVQPEGQKSKTANDWLLPLPQSEVVILALGVLKMKLRLRTASSHFIFLSSSGIKGMHHYCLVSLTN